MAPVGMQLLDQLLERQILVRVGAQCDIADANQEIAKSWLARDICPEDKRVDECSDEPLDRQLVSIRNRGSNRNIFLAG